VNCESQGGGKICVVLQGINYQLHACVAKVNEGGSQLVMNNRAPRDLVGVLGPKQMLHGYIWRDPQFEAKQPDSDA
jgi:hypothetical protein